MVRPEVPVARRQDYEVVAFPEHGVVAALVREHHYSHACSNTSISRTGLRRRSDGVLVGGALYMPPTAGAAKANAGWFLGDPHRHREVLVLSRLVVIPGEPQNTAGLLLAASIRQVWTDPRWSLLLTYADEGEGHTGTIYRATNWNEDTDPAHPRSVTDTWFLPDGSMLSRKTAGRNYSVAELKALGGTRRQSWKRRFFLVRP